MKKIVYQMMLVASMATLTACSSDDPFESTNNNGFTPGGTNTGGGMGGNGSGTPRIWKPRLLLASSATPS